MIVLAVVSLVVFVAGAFGLSACVVASWADERQAQMTDARTHVELRGPRPYDWNTER